MFIFYHENMNFSTQVALSSKLLHNLQPTGKDHFDLFPELYRYAKDPANELVIGGPTGRAQHSECRSSLLC